MVFSAHTYIKNTVKCMEQMLDIKFPERNTPLTEFFYPELNDSSFLDPLTIVNSDI